MSDPSACWPWPGFIDPTGYGRIKNNGPKRVHRVAWELTNGPIPDGLGVLHKCDNPPCCNPAHLFLGTNTENVADMVAKGRQVRGHTQFMAKLTPEMVVQIRARQSEPLRRLANEFGVATGTIFNVITRRGWNHVPDVSGCGPHVTKPNIRHTVEMDGETMSLRAWCARLGLRYKAIHLRVTRYGMDPIAALRKPIRAKASAMGVTP